jgi:3',5'-cyclic AMP phosphodiesterase CpdA
MFTLAHLSDPHIGPIPLVSPVVSWRAPMNKRVVGYVNWRLRRRRIHDMTALDRVVADIAACKPDHVAMTGDLGHVGLPQEFEAAKGFMSRLGTPRDVSFVPGNHDAYVRGALEECLSRFSAYATGDDGAQTFPYLRVRGPVALIGLSTAVSTPHFFATGTLGQEQTTRAEAMLRETGGKGLIRIILIHHAPHQGGAKPMRHLTDAARFEAMLARTGAELVLHGHNHRTSLAHRPGPAGPVPILGVASASGAVDDRHEPAGWFMIRVDPSSRPSITVERRRLAAGGVETAMVDLAGGVPLA